jgi:hypothetical protein
VTAVPAKVQGSLAKVLADQPVPEDHRVLGRPVLGRPVLGRPVLGRPARADRAAQEGLEAWTCSCEPPD